MNSLEEENFELLFGKGLEPQDAQEIFYEQPVENFQPVEDLPYPDYNPIYSPVYKGVEPQPVIYYGLPKGNNFMLPILVEEYVHLISNAWGVSTERFYNADWTGFDVNALNPAFLLESPTSEIFQLNANLINNYADTHQKQYVKPEVPLDDVIVGIEPWLMDGDPTNDATGNPPIIAIDPVTNPVIVPIQNVTPNPENPVTNPGETENEELLFGYPQSTVLIAGVVVGGLALWMLSSE